MESRGKGFLGMAPAKGVPGRFLEMERREKGEGKGEGVQGGAEGAAQTPVQGPGQAPVQAPAVTPATPAAVKTEEGVKAT